MEVGIRDVPNSSHPPQRRKQVGILSDFFGPPSDDQVDRDLEKGHAESRNDAEDQAAFDYVDEALTTGEDPIPSSDDDSSGGDKS